MLLVLALAASYTPGTPVDRRAVVQGGLALAALSPLAVPFSASARVLEGRATGMTTATDPLKSLENPAEQAQLKAANKESRRMEKAFVGEFLDPKYKGGLYRIQIVGDDVQVTGRDTAPTLNDESAQRSGWRAAGKVKGKALEVDMSKVSRSDLAQAGVGIKETSDGVTFSKDDAELAKWKKVYVSPMDRAMPARELGASSRPGA